MNNPALNGTVINGIATLLHQLFQVAVAERIGSFPVAPEWHPVEWFGPGDYLGHGLGRLLREGHWQAPGKSGPEWLLFQRGHSRVEVAYGWEHHSAADT